MQNGQQAANAYEKKNIDHNIFYVAMLVAGGHAWTDGWTCEIRVESEIVNHI